MGNCNPTLTQVVTSLSLINEQRKENVDFTQFRMLIGCLRYLCNTRPDLALSIGLLSQFMQNLGVSHMIAVKRMLMYIKGKVEHAILFSNKKNI